jgi:hypothetical protein
VDDIPETVKLQKKILYWLRLPVIDYLSKHEDVKERRVEGVGKWFLDSRAFRMWVKARPAPPRNTLWCYGKAGCGKTTIVYG